MWSRFCKEQAFDARKISCFMSIIVDLFKRDTVSPKNDSMDDSFKYFGDLLLKHSVQRSPKRQVLIH